jgi:hypothetical protein
MKRILIMLSIAILILALATTAVAQVIGYDLMWWTADSGGGSSTGGGYSISGTIGQLDPGNLSSGEYTLAGGFWSASVSAETPLQSVYLPVVGK